MQVKIDLPDWVIDALTHEATEREMSLEAVIQKRIREDSRAYLMALKNHLQTRHCRKCGAHNFPPFVLLSEDKKPVAPKVCKKCGGHLSAKRDFSAIVTNEIPRPHAEQVRYHRDAARLLRRITGEKVATV